MQPTTVERIRQLLEAVLNDVDDDENRYRLRAALQLLSFIEERQEAANKALADCELDEQTLAALRRLGYLH